METATKIRRSEAPLVKQINAMRTGINRNFIIKVYGWIDGRKYDKAVGVAGLNSLVGVANTARLFERAEQSQEDQCICKLRRGIKVTFYRR